MPHRSRSISVVAVKPDGDGSGGMACGGRSEETDGQTENPPARPEAGSTHPPARRRLVATSPHAPKRYQHTMKARYTKAPGSFHWMSPAKRITAIVWSTARTG